MSETFKFIALITMCITALVGMGLVVYQLYDLIKFVQRHKAELEELRKEIDKKNGRI